ncbi:hypothetical protein RclHR1_24120006 [Rhizophagus clarus]|uniref:Uncharacterized protein n=1 Tax=Rhizophagus clarus TaxID=94130 RepID=A0A2Z6RAB1_9GLOM|nr:hypothetical protein RclHR1_24120006 [Rhizophagus clarus]
MSSELELLRQRISELETKNAKLEAEKAEIEVRNLEAMAEIVKLKAELKSRIEELEKSRADTAVENTRRDDRVEELEQKNTELEVRFALLEKGSLVVNGRQQNDKETIAEVLAVNVSDSVIDQQNDANTKSMDDKEIDNFIPEEPANVPDSVIAQLNQCKPPQIKETTKVNHQERLLEDRKTDAFLDEVHKKKVSDEIRQRKREKKLSQSHVLSQDSSSTISESFQADLSMTNTKHALPEQVVKESTPNQSSLVLMEPQKKEEKQVNLSEIKGEKISYNQKVEQDLICELLEFIRCHDSTSLLNSISSKHIPDVPVNANLTPGSVPHLAHLFNKAEKTGQKEKLRWYYYSEEYEKKVIVLSSENNISDQMARTQIYDEMELYLPGKKREYLRKMTQKAKNIYTLFKRIGIDKIGVVTCSADAISRLTDAQIQNIINLYTDELTKSQKLIGVNNCSRARDLSAESNKSGSKKSPDVGISTPPTSQISKTNQTNVRAQSKPTYDRTYFRNKTLCQYPTLYREFSSENFDYYGITDETSCDPKRTCPLCSLDHDDEESIEGRYKARSYFIKCERREVEIVA